MSAAAVVAPATGDLLDSGACPPVHPEGVFPSVPEQVYLTDRGSLSASGAKELLRSPAHYLARLAEPFRSKATELGTIVHHLVMGTGAAYAVLDPDQIGVTRDGKPAAAPTSTAAWKEAVAAAEAEGKVVLTTAEFAQASAIAQSVLAHPLAGRLFTSPGRSEVSMYWRDPGFEVVRRCRWDRLTDDGIGVDLKTTRDADPAGLGRVVVNLGYDLSADWYCQVAAGLGCPVEAYALVFVEKTPPYPVVVAELDDDFRRRGRALSVRALEVYRRCLDTHTWPGYLGEGDFTTLAPPRWAATEEEIVWEGSR